jgi:hypothetical protein
MSNFITRYKICALDTGTGLKDLPKDNVFYETFEEAEEKCQEYLRNSSAGAFVIFQSCAIVKVDRQPLITYWMDHEDGCAREIGRA